MPDNKSSPAGENPRFLTYLEVMSRTRLGRSSVYKLFKVGELGGYRSGRRVLFLTASVEAYIERTKVGGKGSRELPPPPVPRRPNRPAPPGASTGFRYFTTARPRRGGTG